MTLGRESGGLVYTDAILAWLQGLQQTETDLASSSGQEETNPVTC